MRKRKKMPKFAIRLFHDEPIWTCDGKEITFDSEGEAVEAMNQEIEEQEEDVRLGYLEDCSYEDYRIVEITNA
jgi:hypothetical protein